MTVYLVWDVDRVYDGQKLVSIFSTRDLAEKYVVEHPTERTSTSWTTGVVFGARFISYEIQERKVDVL